MPGESAECLEGESDGQSADPTWEVSPALINMTSTAAAKVETGSLTKIVQVIQVVSIRFIYANKGWKTKTAHHQKNERFSSVQVKVCVFPNEVSSRF